MCTYDVIILKYCTESNTNIYLPSVMSLYFESVVLSEIRKFGIQLKKLGVAQLLNELDSTAYKFNAN